MTTKVTPGTKNLIIGPPGTGKTHVIRTLIDAGITPFVVATEPNCQQTLGDIPEGKWHLHYIAPVANDWADMRANALKVNTASFKLLCDSTDPNRTKYQQLLEFFDAMANFTCDLDGKSYGSVDSWSTDRCLVVDSLSGLSIMAMNLVVGAKPVKNPGEWSVAMDHIEQVVNKLCFSMTAHFVLTAHMEREKDEVSGGVKNMASTLGSKLAPKIPRYFDNVIEAKRQKDQYTWVTDDPSADLKVRNLPISPSLPPSFVPIIEDWKRKGGVIIPTPSVSTNPQS